MLGRKVPSSFPSAAGNYYQPSKGNLCHSSQSDSSIVLGIVLGTRKPGFLFFVLNKAISLVLIYLWLCWVFVSVQRLSPVVASGGHSSSRCAGLSPSRPLLLRSTGYRRAGSVVVAHGPTCSAACGILPDQGSNPCPLHRQADSQPLRHQGSPRKPGLIALVLM